METPTTETPETNYSLLAKKSFGSDFVGEVQEAAPVEVPEEQPEPQEIEEEQALEATEEATEETAEEATEEAEEATVQTFDELIQAQEWDDEWANSLAVKVKIDGEEKPVKISDLRANFQMQEAAQKRLEEAKAAKEAAKAEVSEKMEAANKQLAAAAAIVADAEKTLLGEINNTDLDKLREQDPAEWSAKQLQMQQKRQTIDALKQKAISQYQQAVAQNQEEAQKALTQTLQEEGAKLVERIPEWRDEETAQAEKANVSRYLSDMGFADSEIGKIYDHRFVDMARKAMLFDKAQERLEPAKKKLKVIKKTIAPGSKKSTSQLTNERNKELKDRLRRSGNLDDAFALLKSRTGN